MSGFWIELQDIGTWIRDVFRGTVIADSSPQSDLKDIHETEEQRFYRSIGDAACRAEIGGQDVPTGKQVY